MTDRSWFHSICIPHKSISAQNRDRRSPSNNFQNSDTDNFTRKASSLFLVEKNVPTILRLDKMLSISQSISKLGGHWELYLRRKKDWQTHYTFYQHNLLCELFKSQTKNILKSMTMLTFLSIPTLMSTTDLRLHRSSKRSEHMLNLLINI